MKNYKYLITAGLLVPALSFAEFEFGGELKNSVYLPNIAEFSDSHMRTTLDVNFKSDVFSKDVQFNFGAEYSMDVMNPENGSFMNVDELIEDNNGLNIKEASLGYLNSVDAFDYKIDFGLKIGRIENKLPFTNAYRKDKSITGLNSTSFEGGVAELSHKYGHSYGVAFTSMNTHENLSQYEDVMGIAMGGEVSAFGINAGLHYLNVNFDTKGKPSTEQYLLQSDTTLKDYSFQFDMLNQSFARLSEDTSYMGLSTKVDYKLPINVRLNSKTGYAHSNFDGSMETPIRSLNNNVIKAYKILDNFEMVNAANEGRDADYDRVSYGVDVDFSKLLKQKSDSIVLSIDSVDGVLLNSITYNDTWFDAVDTSFTFGQEPKIKNTTQEVSNKTYSVRGDVSYKF